MASVTKNVISDGNGGLLIQLTNTSADDLTVVFDNSYPDLPIAANATEEVTYTFPLCWECITACDTVLDCSASEASITFTDLDTIVTQDGIQYCEWEVSIDWIGCDGEFAGGGNVNGLTANVGLVDFLGTSGLTNTYQYLLPLSTTVQTVGFMWGVPADGALCQATKAFPVCDAVIQACEGTLVERRFGYGAGVTKPQNEVFVTEWNELQQAAEAGNNHVILDPSLAGQTVSMTSLVDAGPNTWIDGSQAPGAELLATVSGTLGFKFEFGNGVVHCVKMNSAGISSSRIWIEEGQHYWVDHVELYNSIDDAIVISRDDRGDCTDITVSYAHSHDNEKGMMVNAKTTSDVRRITFSCNRLEDNGQRNWHWQSGDEIHDFNNYTHDCSIGINARIATGSIGTSIVNRAIIESSVWENVGNPLNIQNISSVVDPAYQHYVYTDGNNDYGGGSILQASNIDGPNMPAPHTIPYSYVKLPTNEVKDHVLSCAGAQHESN